MSDTTDPTAEAKQLAEEAKRIAWQRSESGKDGTAWSEVTAAIDRLAALAAAPAPAPISDEFEAFKAWAQSVEWWDFDSEGHACNRKSVRGMAWTAWQARALLAESSPSGPCAEPLTDLRIDQLWVKQLGENPTAEPNSPFMQRKFARAIERELHVKGAV